MRHSRATLQSFRTFVVCIGALVLSATLALADVSRFEGHYTGSAEVVGADGEVSPRDMSVTITADRRDTFTVEWTSTTYRADDTTKTKSYTIKFAPSDRPEVYAAKMGKDLFGNEVQLDPMKGEPYVWAQVKDDTMTVYSLAVDSEGGYDMQQFERTLVEGGMNLRFQNVHNGEIMRSVETFLKRQE